MEEDRYNAFYRDYGIDEINTPNYIEDKKNNFEEIKFHFYNLSTNQMGVISLSETPLNILMWAHYSNEQGLMIEFDWEIIRDSLKELNSDLKNYVFFPVQYVESVEKVDFFSENYGSPDVPLLYSWGVKRDDWSYENEWRLIVYLQNLGIPSSGNSSYSHLGTRERKIYYPKEAIKTIVLGKYFFDRMKLLTPVGKTDRFKYQIECEDFDFIKYLADNFNDKIYLSGEIEKEGKLKRSTERIELQLLDENILEIERKYEGFHQR